MPRNALAYDDDFYAWTQEQARLLREGDVSAIDAENIAEEIETMGRSERRELENRLTVLLAHLLKWQYQPEQRSQGWLGTIIEQRRQMAKMIKLSPSLVRFLAASIPEAYRDVREDASRETGLDVEALPVSCPYETAAVLDPAFLPE